MSEYRSTFQTIEGNSVGALVPHIPEEILEELKKLEAEGINMVDVARVTSLSAERGHHKSVHWLRENTNKKLYLKIVAGFICRDQYKEDTLT